MSTLIDLIEKELRDQAENECRKFFGGDEGYVINDHAVSEKLEVLRKNLAKDITRKYDPRKGY